MNFPWYALAADHADDVLAGLTGKEILLGLAFLVAIITIGTVICLLNDWSQPKEPKS